MGKIIFGIASTEFQAEAVVNEWKVADFADEDISVLLADKRAAAPRPTGVPPGLGGGTLGWLPGIEAIAVPGAGPFVAAGPIFPALHASAVGGSNHGIASALSGMGLSESSARKLERKVCQGFILVAAHAPTDPQANRARAILEQAQAGEIVSSLEPNSTSEAPSGEGFGFGCGASGSASI